MWEEVENWSEKTEQEKKMTLEELHKRAYQNIDTFDNYNYDSDKDEEQQENEFSIFLIKDKGGRQ